MISAPGRVGGSSCFWNQIFCRFVIGEVSAALASIHELGLSFNDLKPENLLITELGHIKVSLSLDLTLFLNTTSVLVVRSLILEQQEL
jgi:serine/threonine protein kinase